MYTIPQTPAPADYWLQATQVPPLGASDGQVLVSLSPLHIEDALRTQTQFSLPPTHIIRTNAKLAVADNYMPSEPGTLFPCTVLEVPPGSGHFYAVIWSHVCGYMFSNQHIRMLVRREPTARVMGKPLFVGYA